MNIPREVSPPGARAPLRVLFFDHTAQLGGGEIALYDLIRFLDRARVEPIVLLGSNGPLADKLRGLCELHILPLADEVLHTRKDTLGFAGLLQFGKFLHATRYLYRLALFLRRRQIDLIHTNSLKADLLGGIAGRLAGVPVVWHIRDRIENDYLPSPMVRLLRVLARLLPRFVFANSQATLDTLRLGNAVPGCVIPSGVDLDLFPEPAIGPSPDPPVIGIVGRLCTWKGQHIFLRAAAILHRSWPQAKFQIIGAALFKEKHIEPELHALAAELGIADAVEFTGFRDDVPRLIARLSILVHASITGEPFGQVIVQGMAAGRPVVATRGGGVPEIVLDTVTGLLVPMGDSEAMAQAMASLLADPAAATRMGRAGRQRIEQHFTIQASARAAEEAYAALTQRASPNQK